jgi:hypothetical protein
MLLAPSHPFGFIVVIYTAKTKRNEAFPCEALSPLVTSTLFGPNTLLIAPFSNILSLCFFLDVRDQLSHPSRTVGKIIVLYFLIFKFFDSNRKDRRF